MQLTNKEWVYLASVYDPERRRGLGYKISNTMTAKHATDALQMALDNDPKPMFVHSDMGSQYTSAAFEIKLQHYGIKHSYSLKGHPYDNGRIEAFHSLLKREEVYAKQYHNLIEVQASIVWYIDLYNGDRMSDVA
ncbi:DDE-type integrase/transposase/recombinase [Leuconostoc suionicum]|nr:DDE-type integrase/transposase/recombinase [Leuconostoc suionicum]MDI6651218.1 DDE-type integrase/transposase/recombinase [Leuconostoc suionicum]